MDNNNFQDSSSLSAVSKIVEREAAVAISLSSVSKSFKMYNSPAEKFKELVHPFKKQFHKEFKALKNISFVVNEGESLGLIGRNGAGKSTLLQIICRILEPTEGAVHVNGRISALLELGAGFNRQFTGRENIYMNGVVRGFTKEQIDERFQAIVDFADIGDFIDQPVKIYSSGMFVRLAFADAIHVDPDILIIDEALAVGDQLFQRKCYSRLERFMEDGKTLIFVSHNSLTVNQLCSRALLIDAGDLILDGPAKLVTAHYERLLFSNPLNTLKIRNEIIEMNKDPLLKGKLQPSVDYEEGSQVESKSIVDEKQGVKTSSEELRAEFISGFVPKSTIEYKNYDVEISDISISTPDGRVVNHLLINGKYIFSYKVKFNIDAEKVSFGMTFKTEKGLILSAGASYQMDKPVALVKEGEQFKVDWHFDCYLLPGNYFMDIGVSSLLNDNRTYLNRIVDAIVFKVLPMNSAGYYGHVTFNHYPVIQKIGESA